MSVDASTADQQLRLIADRLIDVAAGVTRDASAATQAVRGVAEHARDIATLAAALEQAAATIAADVAHHRELIAGARVAAAQNETVLTALAGTADTITSIADRIGGIASTSRLLALNARIEAARAGEAGSTFAVVAHEMAGLAGQTKTATHDIASRAGAIGDDIGSARAAISSSDAFVERQQQGIAAIAETAETQRASATAVAALTREAVARIDDTAAGIGRVASSAGIVRLLAGQMLKLSAA